MDENKSYREPSALNSLAEFCKVFGFDCYDTPILPPKMVQQLRYNLIWEELEELKVAMEAGDLVGCLDALADLQYVLSGTVAALGFTAVFAEAFDAVHASNMSKACKDMDEVKRTLDACRLADVNVMFETSKDGKYIIRRVGDGKLIKSIGYTAADLKEFVPRQFRAK